MKRVQTEDHEVLQDLLEEWFSELDAGRRPDPAALCAARPDLLPQFEEIVDRDLVAALGSTPFARGEEHSLPPIAGYEIITQLGRGGRGAVYLARQRSLDRLVALKVLHPDPSGDPSARVEAARRLVREAELTAMLNHPNIVPVFDVGTTSGNTAEEAETSEERTAADAAPPEAMTPNIATLDDKTTDSVPSPPAPSPAAPPPAVPPSGTAPSSEFAFIAMKWLSGPSLDGLPKPIPPQEVARIGIAVAQALHEAHLAGIVHRDIKPANIMLDRGTPCVVDFGLARNDTRNSTRQTEEGLVSGTLPYMSPEQLRAGSDSMPVDSRTDVYSLGVTLYELLTGAPPFADENPAALIQQILFTEPPPLRGFDSDLITILGGALEKERNERIQSAAELAAELGRYSRGESIHLRRSSLIRRAVKRAQRHPRATSAIGLSLGAVAALGSLLAWQTWQADVSFAKKVDGVTRALGRQEYRVASSLLEQLPPTDPERLKLQAKLDAELRLEDVLDALQSRRGSIDRTHLDELSAKALNANPEDAETLLTPARREVWLLAVAAGRMLESDATGAEQAAARTQPSRARAALRAANTAQPWPWDLPEPRNDAVHDALFTVIAMREADVDPAAVRQELLRAEAEHPGDYRVRKQMLDWLAADRHNLEGVLLGFKNLVRHGRHPRAVVRSILHVTCTLQRKAETATWLKHFLATFPRSEWNGIDASILCMSHELLGETEQADQELSAALATWPECPELWLFRARQLGKRHQANEAKIAFKKAESVARRRRVRDDIDAILFLNKVRALRASPKPPPATVKATRQDGEALAKRLRSALHRSKAYAALAELEIDCGNLRDATQWLKKAELDPKEVAPTALLAAGHYAVRACEAGHNNIGPDALRSLAEKGRKRLQRYGTSAAWVGLQPPPPIAQSVAQLYLTLLNFHIGDRVAQRAAAKEALRLGGESLEPSVREMLKGLAR